MVNVFCFFYLGYVIKSAKELVEHSNQLFWSAGTCQLSEANNVCIENTAQRQIKIKDEEKVLCENML